MEKFDAIVIGAGPAGCSAAAVMARSGLNVLVIERGKYPGAKNMWGGAFFGPVMEEIFPDFRKDAPVERYISRHAISFMTRDDCLTVDFRSGHDGEGSTYPGFITLRARFDQWMARKAEQAGAIIATGLEADGFVYENGAIAGAKVGGEEFPANVVILADGANSLLAKKAGLRDDFAAADLKQGVKEVIRLPQSVIEDRFNLRPDEGVAMEFVGACTRGLPGGGFIYTNRDSLSVGVVVQLSALLKKEINAADLLEDFKAHPFIRSLVRDGELLEYSAHLIPVSGLKMMPRLYADGIMAAGDAAAMVLGTGLILEGANFAMAAGAAAAQTAIRAKQAGDFSAAALSAYEQALKSRFVLKDLETFRDAPHFLENERIYNSYPELACSVMHRLFTSDGKPRTKTFDNLKGSLKDNVTIWQVISDSMKARKAL